MPHRSDPLKDLLDLQERMNRLFDETLGADPLEEAGQVAAAWAPAADVYEQGDGYVIEVELAGLARKDVNIQIEGRQLIVRGERHPAGGRSASFHRLERRYGPFMRVCHFEEEIDPDAVKARLEAGLLRVEVPKVAARTVKVTRRDS